MNIEQINEYYHDELEKALEIMWGLLDDEVKHNFKLPDHSREKIVIFTEEFKFKYTGKEKW